MCRVHIRHLRLTGILVSPLRRGSFSRSLQMGLTVKVSPMLQLDVNAGDVPATPVKTTEYISIRCVMALYGFRPYGGSLLSNSHKSKQKGLALPYGRLAKARRCPLSGTVMGARRDGPSLAHRGWRGVLPRHPHNSTCVRPSVRGIRVVWIIEWQQLKQKQKQKQNRSWARAHTVCKTGWPVGRLGGF